MSTTSTLTSTLAPSYYVKRQRADGQTTLSDMKDPSWTGPIRSFKQADKECAAWESAGWLAMVVSSSAAVKREVSAWQRKRNQERANAGY
jgi:hypothetical protein